MARHVCAVVVLAWRRAGEEAWCAGRGARRLVAVVRRERLAAGGEVRPRRGALRARQRGGRGGRRRGRGAPASLAHVARFPHGRSYNTPNTELFINSIVVGSRSNLERWRFALNRFARMSRAREQRVECLMNVVVGPTPYSEREFQHHYCYERFG